jgi:hypothetical protein
LDEKLKIDLLGAIFNIRIRESQLHKKQTDSSHLLCCDGVVLLQAGFTTEKPPQR